MTDNDLIRRGDAREMLQQCGLMGNHPEDPLATMFNEIPAVQPTVSPDVAALVEALGYYADTFCEGFCQDFPDAGYTDENCELDCGGCKARAALARVKGETK